MWPFHKHNYIFVGKTIAKPKENITKVWGMTSYQISALVQGTTTFVWKCAVENCNKIISEEVIGLPSDNKKDEK